MASEIIIEGRKIIGRVAPFAGVLAPVYGAPYNTDGERLITSCAGIPVFTANDILESVTTGDLGIDKQGDDRYYWTQETATHNESTAKITGQITCDLTLSTTTPGYDKPYDLLLNASNTLNQRVVVVLDIPVGTSGGLSAYFRRAAVVTVSGKPTNNAQSGQSEVTFQLMGTGTFVHGIILV